MTTQEVKFTERNLEKLKLEANVTELRDPRFPLRLRFHKSREKASWYILRSVKGKMKWVKIGNWPYLKVAHVTTNVSKYLDNDLDVGLENNFTVIGELLEWYLVRSKTNNSISKKRRSTIKWAITKHLIPLIGNVKLTEINHNTLDAKLFWPLQNTYAVGTVRSIWRVLKQSFHKALKLKLIEPSALIGFIFTDFIEGKIPPKETQLRFEQLDSVYKAMILASVPARFLVLMMLLHGTRIGETRKTKWTHICFKSKKWIIPAPITKTKEQLTLPLTDLAISILQQYRDYQCKHNYDGVYLFPSSASGISINGNVAGELIQEVSQDAWTSHSLRKVARTTWIELGVDFVIGEMMLNHTMSDAKIPYFHTHAETLKRGALEQYHDALLADEPHLIDYFIAKTELR